MQISKFSVISAGIFLLFLGAEFFWQIQKKPVTAWGTSGFFALRTGEKELFYFGEDSRENQKQAQSLLFRFLDKPQRIQSIKTSQAIQTPTMRLEGLGEGLWYGRIDHQKWFFIGADFDGFPLGTRISTQADVWVLEKSSIDVSSLPTPNKAIIVLNKKISKKIKKRVVPIITTQENFVLELEESRLKFFVEQYAK